ncbi:hypothetical protein H0H93_011319 [Arthromyces matolae]|nr:hypothetical protein H0H93_011319 [Arthromyces matolae]
MTFSIIRVLAQGPIRTALYCIAGSFLANAIAIWIMKVNVCEEQVDRLLPNLCELPDNLKIYILCGASSFFAHTNDNDDNESYRAEDIIVEGSSTSKMSTTLEVPTRLRVTDGADPANSARTSVTHFEPPEGAGNTLADGLRPEDSSHESTQEVPGAPEQKADAAEEPSGAPTESQVPQSPQVYLTFLLISGRRRTMSFEPGTTLGRVKELVWNSWPSGASPNCTPKFFADIQRTDWVDERPTGPSYLRVLYLGRMLQDDETLSRTAASRFWWF